MFDIANKKKIEIVEYKVETIDLFTGWIASLNNKNSNIIDEDPDSESKYVPFIVNKNFSFSIETILEANMMNMNAHLENKLQYDFYWYVLPKNKRFNKWVRKEETENLDIVKQYFKCSSKKALQYLKILKDEDINKIKSMMNKGGITK